MPENASRSQHEKVSYEVAGSDLPLGGSVELAVDPTSWTAICQPVDGSCGTDQGGSRSAGEDATVGTY